jgi:MoaA/NifB/PqqE/SkfB family radical SAM enzyme
MHATAQQIRVGIAAARFASLSVVAGGTACNARCPFCISSLTPRSGLGAAAPALDAAAVAAAGAVARGGGAEQAMITGKGEPTLWPDQVGAILAVLSPLGFPRTDLQTNGITIADGRLSPARLRRWADKGLTLASISTAGVDPDANRAVYTPYRRAAIDQARVVGILHEAGLSVRLAVVMCAGMTDSAAAVERVADFARRNGVEQVTVRPVNRPGEGGDPDVAAWIDAHLLDDAAVASVASYLARGRLVSRSPWGSAVYEVDGQNICLATSLTRDDPAHEAGRQLIVLSSGLVSDSWEREAVPLAVLLAGYAAGPAGEPPR